MDLPVRHRLPHLPPIERFNEGVVLFVTVCTANRQALLANDAAHAAVLSAWGEATTWRVGDYLLMPDHAHFFCTPGELQPPNVQQWVKYWKRLMGLKHPPVKRNWQDDCWDTQMRTLDQYNEKLAYVRMNPVRRGLAASPGDWPYQGRLHEIRW